MRPKINGRTKAQAWMTKRLRVTRLHWVLRGSARFWQFDLGLVIEVDPSNGCVPEAPARDRCIFFEQAIVVIHVREFNETDVDTAIEAVRFAEPWHTRRQALGLPALVGTTEQCR
jgi:hypothetical protein